MHTKTASDTLLLNFTYLPSYANYLLQERLQDFSTHLLQLGRQYNMPLLKHFDGLPLEEVERINKNGLEDFLTRLSKNEARQQIDAALNKWTQNLLPNVDRLAVQAEDINLISFLRKQSFLHFLKDYAQDSNQMLEIINEIDLYTLVYESTFTNTYTSLLRNHISEQLHLIQKINNTSPAVIYVFNIKTLSVQFANQTSKDYIGFTDDQLIALKGNIFQSVMPSGDIKKVMDVIENLKTLKDGEVKQIEHRLRNNTGKFRWVRNYISVFKRDGNGNIEEIIGILQDIDDEKKAQLQLQEREQQLLEAQNIGQIGSFVWELKNPKNSKGTPKTIEILEVEASDQESFFKNIQEADKKKVADAIEQAFKTGLFECEYRYNGKELEKVLWVKGIVNYDNGEPSCIKGTIMDVTERHKMLEDLKRKENTYKQSEALANMGNYIVKLETNEVEWTDQLYIIYGLQPQSEKITIDRFFSFIHPDDRERVEQTIEEFYRSGTTDYLFRIITSNGTIKTLRTIAQLQKDEYGNNLYVIGTEQDVTEQQNLIQQFEESERLYKQAQKIAKLGNWRYIIATKETIWSDEMYIIYEVDPSTPISLDLISSFIHPDDKESVRAYFNKCIEERIPYDKRHRILLSNGKIKTLHRKGEVKYDEKGNPVEMFGTTQDVTEQQAFENEIKEKQNFIEKIANATPSIISVYNIHDGKFNFITEGFTKLLGYDTKEAMEGGSQFFFSIIHPDDMPVVSAKNYELVEKYNSANADQSDIVIEFSYRIKNKKGDYRWVQTYATLFDRNSQGAIEHMLNITLDITSQIEASNTIKEQEHFINQIADASPTILYLYDVPSESIAYINKEIYYVLGYTIDEIISAGNNITKMLYNSDDIELMPERKNSARIFHHADSMIQYECRMKSKKGDWCWLLVREVVFKKDDGKVLQILGSALDISGRKEMEKTLLQKSFLLEQSNASLEEFAYVASHDLKEPLRKISTFGDRLVTTQLDKMSDDGKIYLKKIVDASQRMQIMITDLLSISMISGDRSFQPYSLQAILAEVLQTLEFKIEQKAAIITSDPLPEANIVPSQFRQLFQNLISNSLKFVKENEQPRITITYSTLQPQQLHHLQLAKAPYYHKLEFSDNGIGFEEEYAGKIFAIFQRLHGRSEYEGTGIGLAICKKIVEHHGGVIYATGVPDKGATFTIILPA